MAGYCDAVAAPLEGSHEKLYKFKSLRGGSKKYVVDIFKNSRIYLSTPDEFNDPLDCARQSLGNPTNSRKS